MTGPLPLSPMARALSRPRGAPQMAGDPGAGAGGAMPIIPGSPMPGAGGGDIANQQEHRGGMPSFGSFNEMINNPQFQGDWGKIGSMSGAMGMLGSLGANALGMGDSIQGNAPSLPGLGPEEMAAAQASPGNVAGSDLGIEGPQMGMAGPEASAPGMFAGGGIVHRGDLAGPNPPGPDQGYAALSPGEAVVNQRQQQQMGPQARHAMMRALHGGRR